MYEWFVNVEGVFNRLNDAVSTLQNHRENDVVIFRSSTSLSFGVYASSVRKYLRIILSTKSPTSRQMYAF